MGLIHYLGLSLSKDTRSGLSLIAPVPDDFALNGAWINPGKILDLTRS